MTTDAAPSLTIDGPLATIALHRPRRHNCITEADIATLAALFAEVAAAPGIRVLILTASGPTFSSGFDLNAFGDDGELPPGPPAFQEMVDRLEALAVPTICAAGGSIYGGGIDLALACDFRIGVPGIVARMSAARIGVHYYASGLRRALARLGMAGAKRLFLTADALATPTLVEIGFLDRVVAPTELAPAVHELALTLAANAPAATQGMKRALNDLAAGTGSDAAIDARFRAGFGSAEFREGLAALQAKRPPQF